VKAYYADNFVLPLPPGHRFPMEKYALLRANVSDIPQIQLLEARLATEDELLRVHESGYLKKVETGQLSDAEIREIGFPWSQAMVERSKRSAGATIQACFSALEDGVSVNLAGGTHHAYSDKGSGFCVFNDAAVAARSIQSLQRTCVAIIDLDVHQGNGTASIFKNDQQTFTFSMHGEKNFPFRKEASHIDIGLADGTKDDEYLKALSVGLVELEKRFKPEFIIYLAGADPHDGDRLGRLKLSFDGIAKRDQIVIDFAKDHNCPIAIAMAGGYGININTTVQVHTQTIQLALKHYNKIK
jgi:acetoin utilization deacetylase AcuC-like enzyme